MDIHFDELLVLKRFLAPFMADERVYVLYLLSSLFLAVICLRYVVTHDHDENQATGDKTSPLSQIFTVRVWGHTSSLQDLKIFAFNAIIYIGLIGQFLISVNGIASLSYSGFAGWLGDQSTPLLNSITAKILYTIVSLILIDFAIFFAHYLFHKVPFLWEFHKVHHSAEVLTPITLFRMHPVDLFCTGIIVTLMNGGVIGLFFFLSGTTPEAILILGLNVGSFLFYITGYNLRHSQIWMNYPSWLNKILISPAQHQIHHSSKPEHWDKNMGLIFSIWDQWFGTHYNPKKFEKLKFGVDESLPNPYANLGEMIFKPFAESYARLKEGKSYAYGISGIVSACFIYTNVYPHISTLSLVPPPQEVRLAKLTWTEVQDELDNGTTTVLIPTAGVEQNGPHVILGKHEAVISYTSQEIARQLANTLVAPVINYVPEGEINTGHMDFAGTISLPEPIFEATLEHAARSLKSHGFTEIYFIGDSGGNQTSQARVADKLNSAWEAEGVRVAQIGNYYFANTQFDTLLAKGYSEIQIGYHAGMRDTSELLFVEPESVRKKAKLPNKGADPGYSGAPSLSTPQIGKEMLDLKIGAALAEIQSIRKNTQPEKIVQTANLKP